MQHAGYPPPAYPTPGPPPAYGTAPRRDPFAHLGRRVLAYLLDWLVLSVVAGVLLAVVISVAVAPGSDPGQALSLLFGTWLAAGVLYWYVPMATSGRTLGKLLLGIRVVRADDYQSPPGFGYAAVRCLVGGAMSLVPLGWLISLVLAATDNPERRAVHDRAARTRVVRADWSPVRDGYPSRRPVPGSGGSNLLVVLLSVLCALVVISVLAAIAVPVYLDQRARGIEVQMRQDATSAAASLMKAHGPMRFPMRIPAGGTSMIGDTSFRPAPGDSILITLARNGSGAFCVRVVNDSATDPIYLDSAAGTIDHTPCRYGGEVRITG